MITIESAPEKVKFIWPPVPGQIYSLRDDNAAPLAIGDGFDWSNGTAKVRMQVVGVRPSREWPDNERRIYAVVD